MRARYAAGTTGEGPRDRAGEAIDRPLEIVPLAARRDARVHEDRHRVLDDRDEEIGAITEMDVERAPRVARAGADGVEARGVEPVRGELRERGGKQRLARFLLEGCPLTSLIAHGFLFLTYGAVCDKRDLAYERVCE